MRVDLYRRSEYDNKFSFLAVPEGQPIPEEVTNVDWEAEARGAAWDDNAALVAEYGISDFAEQIGQKGYAITGVHQLVTVAP
jgi:hypothetical protein